MNIITPIIFMIIGIAILSIGWNHQIIDNIRMFFVSTGLAIITISFAAFVYKIKYGGELK